MLLAGAGGGLGLTLPFVPKMVARRLPHTERSAASCGVLKMSASGASAAPT